MTDLMELSDHWVATPADDEARRAFADDGYDTGDWEPITVPGHWQSTAAFADVDEPVLYRTEFDLDASTVPGQRWWLNFNGLFYQGDVWLDGTYLGDTEGYFFPHTFEITEQAVARSAHVLGVDLACAADRDLDNRRNLTGNMQHSDSADTTWNPGGIWRPVSVEATGPVRISRLVAICTEADDTRAVMSFTAELDSTTAVDAHLRTAVGQVDHGQDLTVAAGTNTVEWTVSIDRPRLWWPHSLGDPHTQAVSVEVRLPPEGTERVAASEGTVSDRRSFRSGLRTVSMRNWIFSVNGERLFLKGATQGPTRLALAEASPAECRRDVDLAVEAGLDLLRLHAHVARPETYAAADDAGLLLWQDMPMRWGYSRHIRKQAVRQATEMTSLLAHHPSIALWCGHDEPFSPESRGAAKVAREQLPSWNRTVLDRAVKGGIRSVDNSRPIVAHSGVSPHLPTLSGTDSHVAFGWSRGEERDIGGFARSIPSRVRFPTRFGAQAVPDSDEFVHSDAWPELDWDHLRDHHGLRLERLDHYVEREGLTYEAWREGTQRYQATVIRRHIETLRRLKYRPTGGFAINGFADSNPAVSWSVLDHARRPKAAFDALVAACAPVIVVADRMPDTVEPGAAFALDLHVVSDERVPLSGEVSARLAWTGVDGEPDGHGWRFRGDVDADACSRVGTIQFEVPETHGELTLTLTGQVGDHAVANAYTTIIGA